MDDRCLHIGIPRVTAGIAQRKIDKKKPCDTAVLHNIERRANDYSRDAVRLEMPGDQTHGLVTDWSERGEQGRIGLVLPQAPQ